MTEKIQNSNLIGALWMVAAMAAFAVEDTFVKTAATHMPLGQILLCFGVLGAVVFAGAAKWQGARLFPAEILAPTMRLRAGFELIGRLFYALAVTLTPLSSATAILQATPIVVVAGAALIFGETVGWRRWCAIILGLIGVLIIIQPGGDSFSILSLFAVIGMLGLAGRDLTSRAAPVSLNTAVLGFHGFLAVTTAGVLFLLWQGDPFLWLSGTASLSLLGATLSGVFAYAALTKAMRTGDISAVTPFRYSRLLFGLTLGIVLFGETLSLSMIVGCALIVLSGLFILARGHQS